MDGGLSNGTAGNVESFELNDKGLWPMVKFDNGKKRLIQPYVWSRKENDTEIARFTQVPLILAYACTIHKIQGMKLCCGELIDVVGMTGSTLEGPVKIDPNNCFEGGQVYVALSRVKRLSQLHLLSELPETIDCDQSCVKFYAENRKRAPITITDIKNGGDVAKREREVSPKEARALGKRKRAEKTTKAISITREVSGGKSPASSKRPKTEERSEMIMVKHKISNRKAPVSSKRPKMEEISEAVERKRKFSGKEVPMSSKRRKIQKVVCIHGFEMRREGTKFECPDTENPCRVAFSY